MKILPHKKLITYEILCHVADFARSILYTHCKNGSRLLEPDIFYARQSFSFYVSYNDFDELTVSCLIS